ncbi:thiol reductant ABC exporter subunit CydC [Micromonospora noduli]|uniref:ATP-binding/permease protein CydC n=1 Tax=Micromonospora noduli TaxID=709876 RepID=A0A328MV38_9ACTN|nr:thiol reductant ABC exporter subunit CydC [Micromonospora noduli]KAB1922726.1 thiol reductant ABC exporter subunit CydC [Micromonospora noduli]RAN95358.1 ATP-binding/permease protein CydC [Micromonospora noduli]RAO08321.1 ATP-binding/permease protein CydC [Micromonospora noduli]RAO16710.1 ATP-binding/permease protein CydC [Micromonospora noduli]
MTAEHGPVVADAAPAGRAAAERAVLRLARPYLGRLVGAGLLAAATEFAGLALMATATWLLMSAAGQPPLDRLTVAIVAVRALAISRGVFRYTERLAGHDAVLRMITDVRARVFATLAARRGTAHRSGDVLSRLVSDVEAVQDLLLRVLVPASAAAVVGVSAVAVAALISPPAAGALAVGLLVAGVALPALATAVTRRSAAEVAPLRGALATDAIDLTHGAADLAAFGATDVTLRAAEQRAHRLARLERRLAATGFAVDAAGVLAAGVTAAAVVLVALAADVPGVLVGVLAVGTLAAVEVTLALVAAARQWTQLRQGLTRVADLLDTDPPTAPPATGAADLTGPHELRFVDVTVRYRAGAAPALDGVSLDLPAGRRIAVVGPSGAGKSTLAAVLTGTVRPASGRVTLDGHDLSAYAEEALPRAVGGLLAEAYVFHATVRENLLLGRAGAGEEELTAATAAAGLLDWVRAQPAGWDTLVGEEGGQLSGGQRQRLALARALLAAPPVLVLDEPTEGLDPTAADAVLASALAATPAGHSVLLISHRLSGLAELDEIVVLDGGRVIQRGRHAELVAAPGWYRDQWLLQAAAERGYLALAP